MIEQFGTMPNGDPVQRITLTNGKLKTNIITYGASIQDIRLSGLTPSLVLGFEDFEPYLTHPYFGSMVGRVANRIANASFSLEEKQYQLRANNGPNLLHGGLKGIHQQNWELVSSTSDSVTLKCVDQENETGFPGNCEIICTYKLATAGTLEFEISATCDVSTLCNIAHHSYFNLTGGGTILDHHVQLSADHYLPVDQQLIPTGEVKSVKDTDFDFRLARPVEVGNYVQYDHNFCLSDHQTKLRKIALISSPVSKISMEVASTEPGVQFYTGENLKSSVEGLNGEIYKPFMGLALEPQGWPDAPNQAGFPSIVLTPQTQYYQKTTFKFQLGQ